MAITYRTPRCECDFRADLLGGWRQLFLQHELRWCHHEGCDRALVCQLHLIFNNSCFRDILRHLQGLLRCFYFAFCLHHVAIQSLGGWSLQYNYSRTGKVTLLKILSQGLNYYAFHFKPFFSYFAVSKLFLCLGRTPLYSTFLNQTLFVPYTVNFGFCVCIDRCSSIWHNAVLLAFLSLARLHGDTVRLIYTSEFTKLKHLHY